MNILCPNCQKMLQVPEESAGQPMKCPLCSGTFTVPALPQAPAPAGLPPGAGSEAVRPAPPSAAGGLSPAPARQHEEEGVYGFVAPPPQPAYPRPPEQQAMPPTREPPHRRADAAPLAAETAPLAAETAPPAPPPGYSHTASLRLSPQVVPWVAPAAFAVIFLLLFFPWNGAYPGGYGVYTQDAWQGMWGGFSTDPVGDEVLGIKDAIRAQIRVSFSTILYLLLLLASLVMTWALLVLPRGHWQVPPVVRQLLPWRPLIVLGLAVLTFLLLLIPLTSGFSLEDALVAVVDKDRKMGEELEKATTPEKKQQARIKRGEQLGGFNPGRTVWLDLAVLCHVAAVAGAGLDLWLHRRGTRPPPRIDFLR
jgi:hypothetical protein